MIFFFVSIEYLDNLKPKYDPLNENSSKLKYEPFSENSNAEDEPLEEDFDAEEEPLEEDSNPKEESFEEEDPKKNLDDDNEDNFVDHEEIPEEPQEVRADSRPKYEHDVLKILRKKMTMLTNSSCPLL